MGIFSLFGLGNNKIRHALRHGATIIDVRIANEFDQGKIRTSFNIPLDRIDINIERIRHMRKPLLICGNSDSEIEQAMTQLRTHGIKDVYNGGTWTRLLKIIRTL